jgi:hypothetical protein
MRGQWRSKGMANCAYARGANYEGAQICALKLLLIFILLSKRHLFITYTAIHFEMCMILFILFIV